MRAVRHWAGALALVLAATGCQRSTTSQPPASTGTPAPSAAASSSPTPTITGTRSVVPSASATPACVPSSGTLPGGALVLQTVRTQMVGQDARITFVFTAVGSALAGPASFTVGPAQPPFTEDASGRALAVTGSSFLRVRLQGAYGYDPVNTPPKFTYTGPTDFTAAVGTVAEVRRTGDFEGVLSWVVGLTRTTCASTTTLASPPTLVVDVPQ